VLDQDRQLHTLVTLEPAAAIREILVQDGWVRQRFHGDPERFGVVAQFVADFHGDAVRYVADVAGGQGQLARELRKRHGYEAEVVDPRPHRLRGVPGEAAPFSAERATYYDLVVGLHPDGATRAVVEAALVRPIVLVPCCNFWDRSLRLGRDALLDAIETWLAERGVASRRESLGFDGPMNVALVTDHRANR
jgi:hypothetical protein